MPPGSSRKLIKRARCALVAGMACLPAILAASPACCRLFQIDATPILGDDPAVCGEILDANEPAKAEAMSREARQLASQCARDAQSQGRPFVYTYRMLVAPDVDLIVQAVAGTRGERLLLRIGDFRGEFIRSIEVCAMLTVLADGRPKSQGCTDEHPLIKRLRAMPWTSGRPAPDAN